MAIDRRTFIAQTALASGFAMAMRPGATVAAPSSPHGQSIARWLDTAPPALNEGASWGMPWPRGSVPASTQFTARAPDGAIVPLQSWTTAFWPDGSVKWSAHAIPAGARSPASLAIEPGRPGVAPFQIAVATTKKSVIVTNGDLSWTIGRGGTAVIVAAERLGRAVLRNVRLVATAQATPDTESGSVSVQRYESQIRVATVEQEGPVRAVIRVEGVHRGGDRDWLPFTIRLYFHAGSDAVRIVHSIVFDTDADRDFIRGLGLVGDVPMQGPAFDRHVRFAGSGDGVWGEAVQPLTGLRRDPGAAFREAQVAGRAVPSPDTMSESVRKGLPYIPHWGDFTLTQPNADGFAIRKRTQAGHGWIDVDGGNRASGLGFVGGPAGGVAFGQHDFWQRCPVRLDIRGADGDQASFALWYHSPDAPAMDLRFYHDGMGMEDHFRQNQGLDITYEDYEPGWGTPYGVARTTEFTLWALPATPRREVFAKMAAQVAQPPRLVPA